MMNISTCPRAAAAVPQLKNQLNYLPRWSSIGNIPCGLAGELE
ncbi:hypothetical protein P3T23_004394 [Paraburkholderia sp. GAS448]